MRQHSTRRGWCVAALVFAGSCSGGGGVDEAPTDESAPATSAVANDTDDAATVTFSDATTCADLAGDATGDRPCDHVMCDFVPEGSTFDETCGRYFQEGLTSSGIRDVDVRRIAADVAGCVVAEDSDDEHVRVGLAQEAWLSISGPSGLIERVHQRLPSCSDRGADASDGG